MANFPTRYAPHRVNGTVANGPSRTRQEFKDECDINRIVKMYVKTGQLPVSSRIAQYGDFSFATDYMEALAVIERANAQFGELPAKVRSRFKNDPTEFLAFVQDPNNRAEGLDLGIFMDDKAPPPAPSGGAVGEPKAS